VRADDFFEDTTRLSYGMEVPTREFKHGLARALRAGPVAGTSDAEAAVALARLVHDELELYGTSGGDTLTEADMREALLALRALLARLDLSFEPEFRDFSTFRNFWLRRGARNSWQARRDLLAELFEPVHDALAELESAALRSSLATPVSPRGRTGWSRVDEEITELRRHFQSARSAQDHRNIGNDCVAVLEALSQSAYDPQRHLPAGAEEPPVAKTKERLERVIEVELEGPENVELRRLARATIEMAQAVKHRPTQSRRNAGIAADSVIQLANLLRRICEPER
jgi:hypothetical protein